MFGKHVFFSTLKKIAISYKVKINLQTDKFILHQFEGLHNLWDTPELFV